MVNVIKAVRALLMQSSSVTALLGTWGGEAAVFGGILPKGYDPNDGAAITIGVEDGELHAEIVEQSKDIVIVRAVAGDNLENDQMVADDLFVEIANALHGKQNIDLDENGQILSSLIMSHRDVIEPDTGYCTHVGLFQVVTRPSTLVEAGS